jgi:hypothetical protein
MLPGARDPKAFTRWFQLDYFRRARPLRRLYMPILTAVLLLTAAAGAAGVACVVLKPAGPRAVFQAAPVSTPHTLFADRCEVCHTEDRAFQTGWRFWPASTHASSVPDAACLQCHPAGRHNPHQLQFVAAGGQSAGCTQCHHEHRGDAALARLPDPVCTQCHGDLAGHGGTGAYEATIKSFETDHPEFGAWRKDRGGLYDPGTVHFSHKAHLHLKEKLEGIAPDATSPWREANSREAAALADQGCAYCHKADAQRRYMQPIRYEAHCAKCHPLLPQLNGDDWPADLAAAFRQKPLHHPGSGETAAAVRGELLDRFSALAFASPVRPPPPTDEEVRPFFLNRPIRPLDDNQRQTIAQVVHAERSLFATDPKDFQPLPGFENLVDFDVKGGCAYCHEEAGRKDGLPLYKPPRLHDRCDDLAFPTSRFDSEAYRFARNHWFPHARFNHDSHRMMTCTDCHAAETSTSNHDVLMPKRVDCRKCHCSTAGKARSDCLECHGYHDRGQERTVAADAAAVQALLKEAPR